MTVRGALKSALRDMYDNSLRMLVLNLVVGLVALAVALPLAVGYTTGGLLLLAVIGPFAAALMYCAVTLQQTDRVRLRDGLVGLRMHWWRGLVLGALGAAALILVVTSVSFWSRHGVVAWPLTVLAIYVALMFAVWQIHLWPLAVAHRGSLREALREAGVGLARRPLASCALAFALLLVNVVGSIGILPVLTLTIAYSALAAAHFALPPPTEEAA